MYKFAIGFQGSPFPHAGRSIGDVMFSVDYDCLHTLCIS